MTPRRRNRSSLPFVCLNVAITADGKIAPANRAFMPFGSKQDQELLLKLRTRADAVMAGARTVDLFPVNLGPGPARFRHTRLRHGLAEYNLRVIVSGSGSLNPKAEIFRHRFSPIIVLTTQRISKQDLHRLEAVADAVKIFGRKHLDFARALHWLREEWGVKRLLCEGGGELNDALFRAGVVNELYLTLCPLVFGGRHAPTLADGQGTAALSEATNLVLKSRKCVGDELFLVYRIAG
jgi:2,5-diamino-6-(ribosylamino)-4(3H)-pyrimidinone 5'-phosphate reductase